MSLYNYCVVFIQICTQEPTVVTMDTTHSYMVAEPAVKDVAATINNIK